MADWEHIVMDADRELNFLRRVIGHLFIYLSDQTPANRQALLDVIDEYKTALQTLVDEASQ